MIGKKQLEQLGQFTTTAVAYGAGWFVALVYFSDWKVVTKYIPYYNGKYTPEDFKKKEC